MHCVKLTGKFGDNWLRKHAQNYRFWNERAEHVVGVDNFHLDMDYITWYYQHGYLFMTLEATVHMEQVIILVF